MKGPIFVRSLTEGESAGLRAGLRRGNAFTLRRSRILLASAGGGTPRRIARQVGCTDQTVRNVIGAFERQGLACLRRKSSAPKSRRTELDEAKREKLRALLHTSPRQFGRERSLRTLKPVAEVRFAHWHISREVREWIGAHHRKARREGGVRIIRCQLPIRSPWLNRIEPYRMHGKRAVVEPERKLTAGELVGRVCGYYGCEDLPHLSK